MHPKKSPKAFNKVHIATAKVCNLLSSGTRSGANLIPKIFMLFKILCSRSKSGFSRSYCVSIHYLTNICDDNPVRSADVELVTLWLRFLPRSSILSITAISM